MKTFILATIILLGSLFSYAQQETGAIPSTANILGEFSVIGEDPLEFGDVPFDVSTTVNTNDDGRGMFIVEQGPGNPNVLMWFDFPTHLEYQGAGPGGSDLAIDNWTYRKSDAPITTSTGTPINSGDVFTANIAQEGTIVGGKRVLYVMVGARVTPDIDTWAGEYEGELTLTVEYN